MNQKQIEEIKEIITKAYLKGLLIGFLAAITISAIIYILISL